MLNFLINNESTLILERILQSLKLGVDEMDFTTITDGIADVHRTLFQKYVGRARDLLYQKLKAEECMVQNLENSFPEAGPSLESPFGNTVLSVASSDHVARPQHSFFFEILMISHDLQLMDFGSG
ncbi:Squamosa promoter-binding-like protein [Ancistrocladus abbreviatus]